MRSSPSGRRRSNKPRQRTQNGAVAPRRGQRGTASYAHPRACPYPARSARLEERFAAGDAYADGGWVICNELGAPYHPEYVSKTFKRLADEAGLPPMKLHGTRHFYASALISAGLDIAAVSKLVGHSSIAVTSDIYGSLFEATARDAGERVASLIRAASGARPWQTAQWETM